MELRARIRHLARPAAMTAALGALLVPAFAGTATADAAKRKAKRYPVVTSVRPMDAKVGQTITLLGRNFKRGKDKNTVVFKRDGARAVFMRSTLATAKQIRVVVPETLREFLPDNASARFRLRVLSARFSKRFTSTSRSPKITALPRLAGSSPALRAQAARPASAPATRTATCSTPPSRTASGWTPARPTATATACPTATRTSRRATSTTTSIRRATAPCPTPASGPTRTRSSPTTRSTTTATDSRCATSSACGTRSGRAPPASCRARTTGCSTPTASSTR